MGTKYSKDYRKNPKASNKGDNNTRNKKSSSAFLDNRPEALIQRKQINVMTQFKGNIKINDDKTLEKEADIMGKRAMKPKNKYFEVNKTKSNISNSTTQLVSKYVTLSGHFKGAIKKDSSLLGLSYERLKNLPDDELSKIGPEDDLILDGAHGDESSFRYYSPEKLASKLVAKGLKEVKFIELRGCETGKGFSQKLKDSLILKRVKITGGIDAPITSGTNAAKDGAQTAYRPEAQKKIDEYEMLEENKEKLKKYQKKKDKMPENERKKLKYKERLDKNTDSDKYKNKIKKYEGKLAKSDKYDKKIKKYTRSVQRLGTNFEDSFNISNFKDDPKNEELSPAHQRLQITKQLEEIETKLLSKKEEEKVSGSQEAATEEIRLLEEQKVLLKSQLDNMKPDSNSPWKRV
ncbi:hypothetical protein [uncultured Winogradskyella sp.]|uniref:hypothetical protein n=1 Tax=uncultured Winogradskyella sp. TaxID=395353 RepID=UPI00260C4FE0|nr:hypothetical protein [uncultured Winogradskyella sp.]